MTIVLAILCLKKVISLPLQKAEQLPAQVVYFGSQDEAPGAAPTSAAASDHIGVLLLIKTI